MRTALCPSPGRCGIIGTGQKVPPRFAASANGAFIHADDYDDTHLALGIAAAQAGGLRRLRRVARPQGGGRRRGGANARATGGRRAAGGVPDDLKGGSLALGQGFATVPGQTLLACRTVSRHRPSLFNQTLV